MKVKECKGELRCERVRARVRVCVRVRACASPSISMAQLLPPPVVHVPALVPDGRACVSITSMSIE